MSKAIRKIQATLKVNKFYKGRIDGSWGPLSQLALNEAASTGLYNMYFDFDKFRELFKPKVITQGMVDSINDLFTSFNIHRTIEANNPLYIAYMLATTWHETAYTMLPIKEYGGWEYLSKYDTGRLARVLGNTPEADGDGQFYAGRGFVMITGKSNYRKFQILLNKPLLTQPDLALDSRTAAEILTLGSVKGMFTSRALGDYLKYGRYSEFVGARAVINGSDADRKIADHAVKFLECLILI